MTIELRNVCKTLGGRPILKDLNLVVPEGLNYILMGGSGTGKSVTLKHVIGLLKPDRGQVFVDGEEVAKLKPKELQTLRRRMGYLFQNGALINWLTVAENVSLPLKEHTKLSRSEAADRTMKVLELVGMDHAADLHPSRISGGMKLRTGLARALITEPAYVLYDEPNAGLDPMMAAQIHRLISEVRDRLGVTGLVVTHSRACAFETGDRIGVLQDGKILESGTIGEMKGSENPVVKSFLSGGAD